MEKSEPVVLASDSGLGPAAPGTMVEPAGGTMVEPAAEAASTRASVPLETHALERLVWKYRLLARLRARREEAEIAGKSSFGLAEAQERKRLFRRVAREFPGALRELDTLGAAQLEARAEKVEEALDRLEWEGEAPKPGQWLAVVLDFHQTLRDSLMLKRWLVRRLPPGGTISSEVVEEFAQGLARIIRIRGARLQRPRPASHEQAALLGTHLRPPGGRLLPLIWKQLETRHGRSRVDLESMIFGGTQ